MSFNNQHLLILDGNNSNVTLEAIEYVKDFGLDKITLPSHTSHALQPLDVCYFKPFKIASKIFRGATMLKSNHM